MVKVTRYAFEKHGIGKISQNGLTLEIEFNNWDAVDRFTKLLEDNTVSDGG